MNTLAATLLMAMVHAGDVPAPPDAGLLACPAMTVPAHDLQLAFGVSGRLKKVVVERGRRVAAGELLAQLDDEDLAANVALLEVRAAGTHEIESAEAAFRAANDTLQRVREAFAQEAAKQREVDDATARADQTFADLELARQRHREAQLELAAAKARHQKTVMTATFAGVVEDVRIEAGCAVDELASVIRLVDDAAFRIDVAVPTELTLPLRVGQTLSVRFRGPLAGPAADATVQSMAQVADPASRTRIVRLEMANERRLPAGLPVEVMVPAPADAAEAAVAAGAER